MFGRYSVNLGEMFGRFGEDLGGFVGDVFFIICFILSLLFSLCLVLVVIIFPDESLRVFFIFESRHQPLKPESFCKICCFIRTWG